ncbi:quercetin 2,3-dioxygenase [Andreesenia angusta]|uniref:Quercetin 2,3-dioxygenase n=1 Tax=Andreesenia angusta TaxID=39480 RepID=A0A1S1V639_9FIRM|nr:pirin family protein [Andreesenia angusta]OHW62022.1 quercetin 2,3-dioxygenase [Andreesenia angusta]
MAILESGIYQHQMPTQNPFVASMHHLDYFPKGDANMRPVERTDENSGFNHKADWRMYHGENIPGFPAHPHRGFETVTIVTEGIVDHTDGLGSRGRYGHGDVQWMTAGSGLQHCEMFPLVNEDSSNTLELFQVWLSLDAAHRMVEPDYKMLWNEEIPKLKFGGAGSEVRVTLIAGELGGVSAIKPTKDSWASNPENRLSIQLIELDPGASYTLPKSSPTMNRSLYNYSTGTAEVEKQEFSRKHYMFLSTDENTEISNISDEVVKLLLLESEPIDEPIISYGPFVMTTEEEIRQAYADYQKTQFGGWPFSEFEVVHERSTGRFAEYPDGQVEKP